VPIFLLCAFVPILPFAPLQLFLTFIHLFFPVLLLAMGYFILNGIPKIYRQHQAAAVGNVKGLLLDIRWECLG